MKEKKPLESLYSERLLGGQSIAGQKNSKSLFDFPPSTSTANLDLKVNPSEEFSKVAGAIGSIMTVQIQNFNDFNCPYPILLDPSISLRFLKKPCPISRHLASTEEASTPSIPSLQDTLHHTKPFKDFEGKNEGSSLKLPESSILPHYLQNKSASLLNPYPKHFSRKKKHSSSVRSMV